MWTRPTPGTIPVSMGFPHHRQTSRSRARRARSRVPLRHLKSLGEKQAVEVRLVHGFEGPAIDQLPAHLVVVAQEILGEPPLRDLPPR